MNNLPTRPLKFKAHFNRINMQRGNPNVWTVHTSRACHQVEIIQINVPVRTVFNPNGKQPRAYFVGYGTIKVKKFLGALLAVIS
jgi:hypothetical protein